MDLDHCRETRGAEIYEGEAEALLTGNSTMAQSRAVILKEETNIVEPVGAFRTAGHFGLPIVVVRT